MSEAGFIEPGNSGLHSRIERWLRWAAAVVASLAVLSVAGRLVLGRLPATEQNLAWARRVLVREELRPEWDWLVNIATHKTGARVRELVDEVELTHLQRGRFAKGLSGVDFRTFVLSPHIDAESAQSGWRRIFWEHFAPRVRREQDASAAATLVAMEVRRRLSPLRDGLESSSLRDAWREGRASPQGFEAIYTAALRSVGIAARLDAARRTEFWDGAAWRPAPRPLIELNELPAK